MNPENEVSHRLCNLGSLGLLDSGARFPAIEASHTLIIWQESNLLLGWLSSAHCSSWRPEARCLDLGVK